MRGEAGARGREVGVRGREAGAGDPLSTPTWNSNTAKTSFSSPLTVVWLNKSHTI